MAELYGIYGPRDNYSYGQSGYSANAENSDGGARRSQSIVPGAHGMMTQSPIMRRFRQQEYMQEMATEQRRVAREEMGIGGILRPSQQAFGEHSFGSCLANSGVNLVKGAANNVWSLIKGVAFDNQTGEFSLAKTIGMGAVALGVGALMVAFPPLGIALGALGATVFGSKAINNAVNWTSNVAHGRYAEAEEEAFMLGENATTAGLSAWGAIASVKALRASNAVKATQALEKTQTAVANIKDMKNITPEQVEQLNSATQDVINAANRTGRQQLVNLANDAQKNITDIAKIVKDSKNTELTEEQAANVSKILDNFGRLSSGVARKAKHQSLLVNKMTVSNAVRQPVKTAKLFWNDSMKMQHLADAKTAMGGWYASGKPVSDIKASAAATVENAAPAQAPAMNTPLKFAKAANQNEFVTISLDGKLPRVKKLEAIGLSPEEIATIRSRWGTTESVDRANMFANLKTVNATESAAPAATENLVTQLSNGAKGLLDNGKDKATQIANWVPNVRQNQFVKQGVQYYVGDAANSNNLVKTATISKNYGKTGLLAQMKDDSEVTIDPNNNPKNWPHFHQADGHGVNPFATMGYAGGYVSRPSPSMHDINV